MDSSKAAAALRQMGNSLIALAAALDEKPDDSLRARWVAALQEFDVPPTEGLSRAQASAAFKKHGLDPRSCGSWIQGGYIVREGDRRWLGTNGRNWINDNKEAA